MVDRLYVSPLPSQNVITETLSSPQAYQSGVMDAASAFDHMVSRPDLVRIDQDGSISETATVIVGGMQFEDWESVRIEWSWGDAYSKFSFTCAEREPYPLPGQVIQLAPGNEVQIYLGGVRVITGLILTRQVAYDANNHIVQLQGLSSSWYAARSSIVHKTSDFNDKSFTQIAAEILGPTGVGFRTLGNIDETPFKSGATPSAGETILQFLERLARDRKIIVSNTPDGKFLFIGEHEGKPTDELVEGVNIKKMQCVITSDGAYSQFIVRAQKMGKDEEWGRKSAEQEAKVKGSMGPYSVLLTAIEHPVMSINEVVTRANTEKMWNDDLTRIEANVTVYGWFRPLPTTIASIIGTAQQYGAATGHTLWQAGDDVIVHSPMAMLYHQHLKIRTVVWSQDNRNGTQTLLQCVNPRGLNGAPIPMEQQAKPDDGPAETPDDEDASSETPPGSDPPPVTVPPPGPPSDWMPEWLKRLQITPSFNERFGEWPSTNTPPEK